MQKRYRQRNKDKVRLVFVDDLKTTSQNRYDIHTAQLPRNKSVMGFSLHCSLSTMTQYLMRM